jgi:DNA-directed RNA polymerase subunit RPC12/RpoP
MSFTPVILASMWWRGMYPHQKNDRGQPAVALVADHEEWHCDTCGREGRILRQHAGGGVACARCESRFVVPARELGADDCDCGGFPHGKHCAAVEAGRVEHTPTTPNGD